MLSFITTKTHDVHGIRVTSDIHELLVFLDNLTDKIVSIDLETTGLDPISSDILLLSIGNHEQQFVIDATCISIDFLKSYSDYLFVGQNIKFDCAFLYFRGIYLPRIYDVMIVEQRLGMGSGRRNSLDAIILRRLGIKMKTDKKKVRSSFSRETVVFNTEQIIYSGEDVEHLIKIKEVQQPYIERFNLEFLIYNIEFPFLEQLYRCELNGLVINTEKWIKIISEKEVEKRELEKQLYAELKLLGNDEKLLSNFKPPIKKGSLGLFSRSLKINFKSSKQIQTIFNIYEVPLPEGTKKNKEGEFEKTVTVGIKNIQLYNKQFPDNKLKSFLDVYIKYKKVEKHLSSFGYNYLEMISSVTKRLHTVYRQCDTDTGRLSSGDTKNKKPNLQQIPKLPQLRECFGYLPGYRILTIDLSSAELVILGSKAQDFKLIELNENDMHTYLATAAWREILKDPEYKITSAQRTEFKNVNYGTLYGAGIPKIAETLNVSIENAGIVYGVLNKELPKTFEYMKNVSENGLRNGYVVFNDRTNSRRWFPDKSKKGKIKRASINSPIQGTQSDMFKEATVKVAEYFTANNIDAKFLMFTHDEWVIAFKDIEDEIFSKAVYDIIVNTCNLYLNNVKMKASYVIKDTWTK